jgi:two-component system response regulator YesN
MKLILIDDKQNVIDGIATLGHWEQHAIEFAGSALNGQEALNLIEGVRPDIAITDITMPLMDGLAFTEAALKRIPHLKIIILSGYDQFEYAQRAIRLGVLEYLTKPIKIEQIVEAVLRARDKLLAEQAQATEIDTLRNQANLLPLPENCAAAYPTDVEREVILALKAGAAPAFDSALARFFESLDPACQRTASFELLAVAMRALAEMGSDDAGSASAYAAQISQTEDVRSTLHTLLHTYVKRIDDQRQNRGAVDLARDFIREHLHEDISLDDVATAVHFTAGYLAHLFKKGTGETVVEYINRLKMERAAVLICDPTTKISVVAQAVGYNDRRYFTELFRRRYGCSPSEYRERFISGARL